MEVIDETARKDTDDVIDLTLGIAPDLPVWPDDPPVVVTPWSLVARGDPANVAEVRLGSHTGTHVDPPAHFLDGRATVDQLPLGVLVGEAVVADLTGRPGPIGPADLDALRLPPGVTRLLLRTDNSALWAQRPVRLPERWVSVSPAGGRWLVERGIRLVGADFLSIEEPAGDGFPVHGILLEAGVVLVEGLDLSGAPAGRYLLACLPLKLVGGDGAPARAVLVPATD